MRNRTASEVSSSYDYTVDVRGQRTSVIEDTGRTVEYAYDNLGRLVRERVTGGGDFTTFGYVLDEVGNRLERRTTEPSGEIV